MPRLFVAVDVPGSVREELANLCHGVDGARWVDLSQLHLTLEFAGDVDRTSAELLAEALAEIRAPAFELALRGVGFFPPRKFARVLWIGVTECPPLLSLQRRVRQAVRDAGVKSESRKFSPHITLARFRVPVPQHAVAPFVAAHSLYHSSTFGVSTFHLYSSVLARSGAEHTLEQSYPLE